MGLSDRQRVGSSSVSELTRRLYLQKLNHFETKFASPSRARPAAARDDAREIDRRAEPACGGARRSLRCGARRTARDRSSSYNRRRSRITAIGRSVAARRHVAGRHGHTQAARIIVSFSVSTLLRFGPSKHCCGQTHTRRPSLLRTTSRRWRLASTASRADGGPSASRMVCGSSEGHISLRDRRRGSYPAAGSRV